MGRIYIFATPDLPNHSVIYESKKSIGLTDIKKEVGIEKLEVIYEAEFNGFRVEEFRGYAGFDESTNELLSIGHPEPYAGYINTKLYKYKTNISQYVFKVNAEKVSLEIAEDYHEDCIGSKKIASKLKKLSEQREKNKIEWNEKLSLTKKRAEIKIKKLDWYWQAFTNESEIKIKEFYKNNPYKKIEPSIIGGLLQNFSNTLERNFIGKSNDHWQEHVEKCKEYFLSLLPKNEILGQIKLNCLYCEEKFLVYKFSFNGGGNIVIDGETLPDINTDVTALSSYCSNCNVKIHIPVYFRTKIFPKYNHYRWTSIWWSRYRFWGKY